MTVVRLLKRWDVQLAVAVTVAFMGPVVTRWQGLTLSLTEEVVVGVGICMFELILYVAYSLHDFRVERSEAKHVLEVIDEGDCLLLELQARLREIASRRLSGKPNHVFSDYCRRSLEGSLSVARGAAQRGELEVRDHHFATIKNVLEAFEGCRDRTFRCVWLVEAKEDLFDKTWREYMAQLVDLSRERSRKRRVQIRILFVLTDKAQLERDSFKTVLGFVSREKGFEHRLILQDDYKMRLRDGALKEKYLDFGIYGDHLLFRTESYDPNTGVFSDNQTDIDTYRKMHDDTMKSAEAVETPTGLPADVSVEQFLNCDKVERPGTGKREE